MFFFLKHQFHTKFSLCSVSGGSLEGRLRRSRESYCWFPPLQRDFLPSMHTGDLYDPSLNVSTSSSSGTTCGSQKQNKKDELRATTSHSFTEIHNTILCCTLGFWSIEQDFWSDQYQQLYSVPSSQTQP